MNTPNEQLSALKDIKQMMERSSRFISLSGLSGIAAGTCALIGAYFAHNVIEQLILNATNLRNHDVILYERKFLIRDMIGYELMQIAVLTFAAALLSSFLFTYLRSKKTNTPLWGTTAIRLTINVCIPLLTGGIFLLYLMQYGIYGFIAPGCLIFYGLALLNAGKYTLKEKIGRAHV